MNVASKELCQELFEASWLVDGVEYWYRTSKRDEGVWFLERKDFTHYDTDKWVYYPAYDLGYLLRKLPGIVELHRYENGEYSCDTDGFGFENADTPEDAACKLAIELFKQGILTKEQS